MITIMEMIFEKMELLNKILKINFLINPTTISINE